MLIFSKMVFGEYVFSLALGLYMFKLQEGRLELG
jgi:hypothetical protein